MKKKILLFAIATMLFSAGFSQNGKAPVKIYIGSKLCGENATIEMSRSQLLRDGKLTIIVSEKDTVNKITFSMQMTKGKDLTEMIIANDAYFNPKMRNYIASNNLDSKANKIWIEKITMEYKGEIVKLPMFTIMLKD